MLGQASALAVTCCLTHLKPDLLWVRAVHLLRAGWLCSCVALGSSSEDSGFSPFLTLRSLNTVPVLWRPPQTIK